MIFISKILLDALGLNETDVFDDAPIQFVDDPDTEK